MGHHQTDSGFTIVEVVVTLGILSLFLVLFFQMFLTSDSQKRATVLNAAANDVAQSNLRKIARKTSIPSTTTACDPSTTGSANPNNGLLNQALNPTYNPNTDPLAGSTVTMTPYSTSPPANTIMAENLDGSPLPSTSTQTLIVMYPRGCDLTMPAKIISIVTYGSNISQKAVHEAYVN